MSEIISNPQSPLPNLCLPFVLTSAAQDLLDEKNIPPIGATLARKFFRIVETLGLLVENICEVNEIKNNKKESFEQKHYADRLLRETEALMHQMCEVAEFLADAIDVLIPSKLGQKKVASNAKRDIYEVINFDFKIPINLIKHDSSEMHWIEAGNSEGYCFGFVLQSILSPSLSGPASKIKPVAEAYSFFYLLRVVLPHFYKMCGFAESILQNAGVFESKNDEIRVVPYFDSINLFNLIEKIKRLPLFGFPNESGLVVPRTGAGNNFVLLEGEDVMLRIPGVVSINVAITHVGARYAIQLPFATMQKTDPRRRVNLDKRDDWSRVSPFFTNYKSE